MKKSLQVFTFGLALSTAFAMAQTNPGTSGQAGQPGQSGTYQNGQAGQPGQPGNTMPDAASGATSDAGTATNAAQPKVDDQTIQRQVHEQLATNPDFQGVQVSASKGDVTLSGTVPNKNAKKEAKKLARSVPGVKKVKEDVTVASNGAAASSSSVGNQAGTSGSTTGVSGEAPSQGSMSEQPPASANPNNTPNANPSTPPNAPPQSNFMPQSAQSGSSADQNSGAAPNATTQNPSAEDSGRAPSAGQSGSVSSPEGQTGSANSQANGESSDQVKKDIQTAFTNEPTLSSSNVTVDATADTITLSGSAPSEKDRDEARRIAQSFAGNRKIVDNISVSGGAGAGMGSSPTSNVNPSSNSSSTPNSTTGTGATPNQNPEQPNPPKK
jgi:hyperosmotically inducible periplasmic protein